MVVNTSGSFYEMTAFDLTPYREKLLALHRHICPRQILGLRMGLLAGRILDVALPDLHKRLFAFVETDGCFADGVSVATGCALGHRTLRLIDEGKVAATFVDLRSDPSRGLRIHPRPDLRDRARAHAPFAQSRWQAMLDAYQSMHDDALLCVQPVTLTVSMRTIISKPGKRVCCSRCGEEIVNGRERKHSVPGEALCASCVGDSYWSPHSSSFGGDVR